MNWNKVSRRLCACVLAAGVCAGAPPARAKAEDGSAAMGRYVESDVALPEGADIRSAVLLEDGAMRIIGSDTDGRLTMWDSSDGGDTWEQAAALPEEYDGVYFMELVLSPDGGGAGITMESRETEMADAGDMDDLFEFYFVSFDAEGNASKHLQEDYHTGQLAYTPAGELLELKLRGGVAVLAQETGETVRMVTDVRGDAVGLCGEELLLLTESEAQRYRLSDGEPLSRDDALNEALFGNGASYALMTASGRQIVLAQDEENRLYYCTKNGIFSHVMDGSVVEQVVDGTLTVLSSPDISFNALLVRGQSFYLVYTGAEGEKGMMKYEYNRDVRSMPEKELTIYLLKDNSVIRQAAVQFQKLYPDTYVNIEVGMSGTDGVTVSDALRTLNTDILAGNGPDLIVLDGISVGTYAKQGILLDLSEIISELQESDGLFEHVAGAYQTEDGAVSAVPVLFSLQVAAGEREIIEGLDGFDALAELAAQPDALDPVCAVWLPDILYPVCAGSWQREDGTLEQEKLEEFVRGMDTVWNAYRENASQETLEMVQNYRANVAFDEMGAQQDLVSFSIISLFTGESRAVIGALGQYLYSYCGLTSINRENGNCGVEALSMQQSGVFMPLCTLGVLNTGKEQERACEFVRFMLSEEEQSQISDAGFPVNRTAFDALLSDLFFGEGDDSGYSVASSDGDKVVNLSFTQPTEEERAKLKELAEQAVICADTGLVQKEAVMEETYRCLDGEITAEEAVRSIMQKVNLYLAE